MPSNLIPALLAGFLYWAYDPAPDHQTEDIMRNFVAFSIVGLLFAGCAGGMGGDLGSRDDTPPACRAGNMALCQQQLMQQNQQQYGMSPDQQQMMMQQQMGGGMGGGTMQPGMMSPVGMQPGMMQPGPAAPGQPSGITPEQQNLLERIQRKQQQQTAPDK